MLKSYIFKLIISLTCGRMVRSITMLTATPAEQALVGSNPARCGLRTRILQLPYDKKKLVVGLRHSSFILISLKQFLELLKYCKQKSTD